jgi:hypothetical protein
MAALADKAADNALGAALAASGRELTLTIGGTWRCVVSGLEVAHCVQKSAQNNGPVKTCCEFLPRRLTAGR